MNQVLSLVQAARTSSDPGPGLYSDHMLAELLALHEDMIVQLRLERLGVVGSAEFLTGMIAQHEKTAAMLRAKLEGHEVADGPDEVVEQKASITKFASGVRRPKSVRFHLSEHS